MKYKIQKFGAALDKKFSLKHNENAERQKKPVTAATAAGQAAGRLTPSSNDILQQRGNPVKEKMAEVYPKPKTWHACPPDPL